MPPYGELAPSCGTSASTIPNSTAHATNRTANSSFVLGLVTLRAQPWRPPSATIAERMKMYTNPPAIAVAARRITKLFGKSWNQMVKIVTRASLGRVGISWMGRSRPPVDASRERSGGGVAACVARGPALPSVSVTRYSRRAGSCTP